jgi:UDP-2-acetamido-2,6-beta-L-arabino-hexul-4-ose reductase
MIKVGVTGSTGFIGYHLTQTLRLKKDKYMLIDFDRVFFSNQSLLDKFVKKCDVIIHLASLNRHNDSDILSNTNLLLTSQLIESLERTSSKAHVFISSSTQEKLNNEYGISKIKSRQLFSNWSKRKGANFTGLIIPNVFGPFCKPFYNSVIATFSHLLSIGQIPEVFDDKELKLIYVGDLVERIIELIELNDNSHELYIKHTKQISVSEILALLMQYRDDYLVNGNIPQINNNFDRDLFNTFRSYVNYPEYFPKKYLVNSDDRGVFVEIIRNGSSGQTSFSTTKPDITRGNHFHTRKIERFAVISGSAQIQLRKIGSEDLVNFFLDDSVISYVDMPIWYTHNIKNIGKNDLITIFWIDEPFDINKPDTFFEKV